MVGFSTEDKLTPFIGVVNPAVLHSKLKQSAYLWLFLYFKFPFLYDPRTVMPAKCGIGKGYGGRMRVDR
jgi:hypothetical protein